MDLGYRLLRYAVAGAIAISASLIANSAAANGLFSSRGCQGLLERVVDDVGRRVAYFRSQRWPSFEIARGDHDAELRRLFDSGDRRGLRRTLLPCLMSASCRKALDAFLERDFRRQSNDLEKSGFAGITHAWVGAGPHTTVLIHSYFQRCDCSRSRAAGRFMVVERDHVGGTFWEQDFLMNSPEEPPTNVLPGAVFQLSDYLPQAGPPRAHDFGFLVRLNLRATGVRVLKGFEAETPELTQDGDRPLRLPVRSLQSRDRYVISLDFVAAGTGFSRPKLTRFQNDEATIRAGLNRSEAVIERYRRGKLASAEGVFQDSGGLMSGRTLLRFLRTLRQNGAGRAGLPFDDRPVAIVGNKHQAFVVAEEILSARREASGSTPIAPSLEMYGLKSHSREEFLSEIRPPTGSEGFRQMIQRRYERGGIPDALENGDLLPRSAAAVAVRPGPVAGLYTVRDETGRERSYGLIVFCTGADRSEHLFSDLLARETGLSEENIVGAFRRDPIGRWLISPRHRRPIGLTFGPGALLPVNPDRLAHGPIGNRDALFVTLPDTERLADALVERGH